MSARAPSQIDPVLIPFVQSEDYTESERLLGHLISEHAAPIIKGIVSHKLRALFHGNAAGSQHQEAEDVCSNAVVKLIARLNEVKRAPELYPIRSLANYAAVISYNACNEHLRRKYPLRNSLKNKLRYLLTHRSELAIWEGVDRELICGYSKWRGQRRASMSGIDRKRLRDEVLGFEGSALTAASGASKTLAAVLAVFAYFKKPIDLDDLVGLLAEVIGISHSPVEAVVDKEDAQAVEKVQDPGGDVEKLVEHRLYLEKLWREIGELPQRQRISLLLNLKDSQGENGLELFSLTGVAGIKQIAVAVEMQPSELSGLWNDLPLEDSAIAERLALTRQQVINLRKCARERLARRLKRN